MTKAEEVGGLLKRIGNYEPKLFGDSFEDRLILQKTVYLLQAFGLYLGYHFNWYLRGPYSLAVTRHGYELIDTYDNLPITAFAEGDAEKRFGLFLSFISKIKKDANMLELLASIHFLKKRNPYLEKNDLHKNLEKKMLINKDKFEEAFGILEEYKLV